MGLLKNKIFTYLGRMIKSPEGNKFIQEQLRNQGVPAIKRFFSSPQGQTAARETVIEGLKGLYKSHKALTIGAGVAGTLAGTGLTSGTLAAMARSKKNREDINKLKKRLKMKVDRGDVGAGDIARTIGHIAVGGEVTRGIRPGHEKSARVLTPDAREDLPAKAFAGPGESYPVQDKRHVLSAIAYAKKNMNRSGESGKKARSAWPKIRAAAKKHGIDIE